jgi:hypothetical protein
MNNQQNLTPEERDRLMAFFDLLMRLDKKQNPENYTDTGKIGTFTDCD